MSDLFEVAGVEDVNRPLADRLRPKTLEEVVGQQHILSVEGTIGRMAASGRLSSLVLWGPPGTGKTTIARLLANHCDLAFEQISAIFSGVKELRQVFESAKARRMGGSGRGTLLFVDEIHRFNKAQQDGFLPYVEDGTIILVGATTENPSFELNGALLSRMQVLVLNRHDDEALEALLTRAEADLGHELPLDSNARSAMKAMADGDGRYLLNCVETLCDLVSDGEVITPAKLAVLLQKRAPAYDKSNEEHYNMASALQKSIRGSDVDAALYWTARMLVGGEDPMFIIRRLVRIASEDVGMADPQAITQALAAKDAYHFLGSPEGDGQIMQAVVYLATAPKSNAAYMGQKAAMAAARATGSLRPPMHALNAPTPMMGDLGYGDGYKYDHDSEGGFSGQNYFPDDLPRTQFYQPVERGFEREINKRLSYWAKLRK